MKTQIFRKRNLASYMKVMAVWLILSAISSIILKLHLAHAIMWWAAFVWATLTCFAGMMIMFMASVINLRKLAPGFNRLAFGEKDPKIPPVWCPVLTMATKAATDLAERMASRNSNSAATGD